jgi:hypothetical protein
MEVFEAPMGVRITLRYRVIWVHESDVTVDERGIQTFYKGVADVERAIALDPNRNGLASFTWVAGHSKFEDENLSGSQVVAVIDVRVRVIRTYGAPNG